MKIGSAITFLLLALIALGFLLSDNINTHVDLVNVERQLEQTTKEKEAIQKQLDAANAKVTEFNIQVEQLVLQVNSLQGQVRQLQDANQTLTDQNTQLQQQVAQLNILAPLTESITTALSSPLSLAIFLPVVPMSMAATYVLARTKKQINQRKDQEVPPTSRRTISAQLTEEEMKHLITMRRGR
jgi:TolA-binding protein